MDPLAKTDTPSIEQRLAAIEEKLDMVLAHLGASAQPSDAKPAGRFEDVENAVSAGKLIQAIKLYRQQTGVGLREAKEAVDGMAAALRRR